MKSEQRSKAAKTWRVKRCSSRWTPPEADYTYRCCRHAGHRGEHFAQRETTSAEWPNRSAS